MVITLLLNSIPMLLIIFHHSTFKSKTANTHSEILKICIRMAVTNLVPKSGEKKERSSMEEIMFESVYAFQSYCPNLIEQKLGKTFFRH